MSRRANLARAAADRLDELATTQILKDIDGAPLPADMPYAVASLLREYAGDLCDDGGCSSCGVFEIVALTVPEVTS